MWKESFIVPLHKSGDTDNVRNYRPISKLNSIAQLFDSLIHGKLSAVFGSHVVNQQHGFVKNRSTLTNLLNLTEYVADSFSDGTQVDAIYTDFSKAFDRVNLDALTYKLRCSGIKGNLLRWIVSYLTNRSQVVRIGDTLSRRFSVRSGVPQGSHLGPLLFVLFINDLGKHLNPETKFLFFADDCKIFYKVNSPLDCQVLQASLDSFADYCRTFCLDVNLDKCVKISFRKRLTGKLNFDYSLFGVKLSEVSEVRDLGVILDSKLTYKTHIEQIYKKALRMLGYLIRTCRDFGNLGAIKAVYFSFVRSHLEYCCQVWSPRLAGDRVMLEKIQRRFIRFIFHKGLVPVEEPSEFHYHPLLESLNLQSLECRRDRFDSILLLRVIYFGAGDLSLDKYYRPNECMRQLRSHRTLTTLIDCPSTLNRCINFFNDISFNWDLVSDLSYSEAMRVVMGKIPLFR